MVNSRWIQYYYVAENSLVNNTISSSIGRTSESLPTVRAEIISEVTLLVLKDFN